MSYIEGPTLEKVGQTVASKQGHMNPHDVAWIVDRILNALLYLHQHSVVHGDLKPGNIIIQPERHAVVLVDFGLSMVRPTKSTPSKGYTMYFSPPEQQAGKPLLPQSDHYSLGQVMLFMLGGGYDAVEKQLVPSTIPDEMKQFIKRMIRPNVLDRPQHITGQKTLWEEWRELRTKVFGSDRSDMRTIEGWC